MTVNMEKLQEDVSQILQTQAAQGQVLSTITNQLNQNNAIMAQQASQINALTTNVEVMKSENLTWRLDTNTRMAQFYQWQSDAPVTFIPRKEHEAMNLLNRVITLETTARDDAKDATKEQMTLFQWMGNNVLQILFFLIMLALTLANMLHLFR